MSLRNQVDLEENVRENYQDEVQQTGERKKEQHDEESGEKKFEFMGYKSNGLLDLRNSKEFQHDIREEFATTTPYVDQIEESTHLTLFLQGLTAVKNVGVVCRNLLSHKEKFIQPYKHLFRINIIYLCGFHFLMKYIVYPLLLHFFGNDQGEITGNIPMTYRLIYSMGYYVLLMFAYIKSEDHYKVIATEYNNLLYHNNREVKASLTTMYFSIITSMMLGISFTLGIIYPTTYESLGEIGNFILKSVLSIGYLFLTSVLYSIYAFNMKLHLRTTLKLSQRVEYFDSRIFFFFGFGVVFTGSCLFVHPLVGNAIYAFLFPIMVCLAFETHTTDGIGKHKIPLMKGFFKLLSSLTNVLVKQHED